MAKEKNSKHYKYEKIIQTWKLGNERFAMSKKIEKWIQYFPDVQHEVLLDLLKHFSYYSDSNLAKIDTLLFNRLNANLGGEDLTAVYIPVLSKKTVSNSEFFFNLFVMNNALGLRSFNTLKEFLIAKPLVNRIIIYDNFSGTGDTFIDTIKEIVDCSQEYVKCEYVFLVAHITKSAIKAITKFKKKQSLKIDIIYYEESNKAFTANVVFDSNVVKDARESYVSSCNYVGINKNQFGYKKTEALVAFEKTTPNNTLPLFYEIAENYQPLFVPRHNPVSNRLKDIRKEKSIRKANMFYETDATDNQQFNNFLVYCLKNGKYFSLQRASKDLGLVYNDCVGSLNKALSEGFLSWNGEKYIQGERKYIIKKKDQKEEYSFSIDKNYVPVSR